MLLLLLLASSLPDDDCAMGDRRDVTGDEENAGWESNLTPTKTLLDSPVSRGATPTRSS